MKIYPMTIEVAESNFRKFSQVALSSKEMSKSAFMKAEKQCEVQYNSLGKTQNICEKLSSLVDELMKNGKLDWAGVVCSRLSKFTNVPKELYEKYIKQGLEIAELQNDKMHIVARLENLHKEYEKEGNSEKLRKVLVREESTLKEILDDFDGSIKNYRTTGEKEFNIDNFKDILATTQVDLAKILLHSDPKKAMKKLKSAIRIFKSLGAWERCDFAKMLLRMAKENHFGDDYIRF